MIIKTRSVADRGGARRDQAAPSLRAAGAAGVADRGRQRRILRLDREPDGEARNSNERRGASSSPSIRGRRARAPSCSTARGALAPRRKCRSRRSIPRRDRSSTIPRRSGGPCSRSAGRARARSDANSVVAIGITNQRETTVVWERATGRPLANAIVWQDRRTADLCAELAQEGWDAHVAEATGLVIDPYFSATKLAWLLRNCAGPRCPSAGRGGVLRHDRQLPAVQAHRRQTACDRRDQRRPHQALRHQVRAMGRQAARTAFGVPRAMLPEVRDSQGDFGSTRAGAFRRRDPDQGRRRRSTGGGLRPGLLHARHAQGDLRHRLLRARQYRRGESGVGHAHALDHLPSARRQAHLRAGRRDLHGRRHGAVAAGQSRPHRHRGRERGLGAGGRPQVAASISFPPFRDSARRSGMRTRGPPFSG